MRAIITSGILVIGILFIRRFAIEKITRRLQYSIWIILPIILIITPYLQFDIPIPQIKKQEHISSRYDEERKGSSYVQKEDNNFANKVISDVTASEKVRISDNSFSEKTNRNLDKMWNVARYSISFIIFLFYVIRNGIFAITLFKNRIFYQKDEETKLDIYIMNRKETPFLFGRSVYLHLDMIKDEKSMRYMILHEYCHLKQGDICWNILKSIYSALYWFNPFVWIALHFMNKDCELACDEAVVSIIGSGKQKEYGMTLLTLFKEKQEASHFSLGTFMQGRKSMIKERIYFLSKPFTKSRWKTLSVGIAIVILIYCSLAKPYMKEYQQTMRLNGKEEKDAIEEISGEESINFGISKETLLCTDNKYYNSIKRHEDDLYFASSRSLNVINTKTNTVRQLMEGNFLLGNIVNGYLYYMKYPTSLGEEAGVGRVDLISGEAHILVPWIEEYQSCTNVYVEENSLYLEVKGRCDAYFMQKDRAIKLEEKDNLIYCSINQFDLSKEEAYSINSGYVNSIIDFSKFTLMNRESHELYICDTETKNIVKKESCFGNILISDKGVIYTALNGDIILCPLNNAEEEQVLFLAKENDYFANYGTYDKNGLYVFKENGTSIESKRVSWEGEIVNIKEIPNTELAVEIGFSAFSDYIAYCKDGTVQIQKLLI